MIIYLYIVNKYVRFVNLATLALCVQGPDDVPVPGGTVYVRQRACQYPAGTYVNPANHIHVRRFIVPKNAYSLATKSMSAFEHMAVTAISEDGAGGSHSGNGRVASRTGGTRHGANGMKMRAHSAPHTRLTSQRPESMKSVAWS